MVHADNTLQGWESECFVSLAEYCQSEYFSVNCTGVSDVILISGARYGRMQAGRCVSGYGKLGCYADVTWYMGRRCSGRRHCRVYVADPVLHRLDVCHSDLTSYLEAKHSCVTGALQTIHFSASDYFHFITLMERTRDLIIKAKNGMHLEWLVVWAHRRGQKTFLYQHRIKT